MFRFNFLFVLFFVSSILFAAVPSKIEIRHMLAAKIFESEEFGGRRHEYAIPLVVGNDLFIGSTTGRIAIIDKVNGSKRMVIKDSVGLEARPLFYKSVLYFGLNDGSVRAYSYRTGDYSWKYQTNFPVHSTPCVSNGILVVTSSDDIVHAFDAGTGKQLWEKKKDFPTKRPVIRGTSSPYCDGENVFVGFSDGTFMLLNLFDGNTLWEKNLNPRGKFRDVDAYPYVDDQKVIVPSYDGSLFALKKENGAVLWEVKDGSAKGVKVFKDQVFFASDEGFVYSININDGSTKWKYKLSKGIPTSPVLYKNKYLVFGSSEEGIVVIDKETGEYLGKFNTGRGILADPIIDENRIFILSNYGILYGFEIVSR